MRETSKPYVSCSALRVSEDVGRLCPRQQTVDVLGTGDADIRSNAGIFQNNGQCGSRISCRSPIRSWLRLLHQRLLRRIPRSRMTVKYREYGVVVHLRIMTVMYRRFCGRTDVIDGLT